eukprot:Rmarinus@m.15737
MSEAETNNEDPVDTGTNEADDLIRKSEKTIGDKSFYRWVTLEELLNFLFPMHEMHPKSIIRLYIYADHGPLENGNLMGGFRRQRRVETHELKVMIEDVIREDIVAVYVAKGKMVSRSEADHIMSSADPKVKRPHMDTVEEILDLLDSWNLTPNAEGKFRFDELQCRIKAERRARIEANKKMFPDLTHSGSTKSAGLKKTSPTRDLLRKLGSRFVASEGDGRSPEEVAADFTRTEWRDRSVVENHMNQRPYLKVQRTLHQSAHLVCEWEDKNHPSITKNVTVLRESGPVQGKRWDPCYS